MMTRRSLLAASAALPLAQAFGAAATPVGLEMFSVRDELAKDPKGTVRLVAQMGYKGVEFFAPYTKWTVEEARDMRKLLDELGIRCFSTHNGPTSFSGDGMKHAIELNNILGSGYVVMASAGRQEGADSWKRVAQTLNGAAEAMRPAGLKPGYHNHQLEFTGAEGERPMEILAANTGKDVMLQLDVGTCVQMGVDPVWWIERNPGRIKSLHLKDWSPEGGYKVLFGEGVTKWKPVLAAAKTTGGAEYFLIEQEGSRLSALETAERCLETYRKMSV